LLPAVGSLALYGLISGAFAGGQYELIKFSHRSTKSGTHFG
jgi:hypothetical protein